MPQKNKKKRVQKGRVIRLSEEAQLELEKHKKSGESWSKFLLRLVEGRTFWALPSIRRIFETKKEAKGIAVLQAVQMGSEKPEEPIRVIESGK